MDFGGYFKEAIRVSTFSNQNYSLVEQIIEQAAGENAIFRESCGFKDDVVLNQLLGEMVTNQIQKTEFNKTLKDLKVIFLWQSESNHAKYKTLLLKF